MQNYMAMNIGSHLFEFNSEVRYCEVVFKDGDTYTYQGLYLMEEKIKQGNGRIDIADFDAGATNLSYASHILAANVDMAALIVTLRHPETSTTFIDRFLATCEAYRVPACIIFNKVDLLSESELEELAALRALYESLGYATYAISALSLISI